MFSGTASKTIKIIDTQTGNPNIANLFKYFFKKIMNISTDQIIIALSEHPKEITCKGVLRADINDDIVNCPVVFWLGGNDDSVWSKALNKSSDLAIMPYYRDLETENNKLFNSLFPFSNLGHCQGRFSLEAYSTDSGSEKGCGSYP